MKVAIGVGSATAAVSILLIFAVVIIVTFIFIKRRAKRRKTNSIELSKGLERIGNSYIITLGFFIVRLPFSPNVTKLAKVWPLISIPSTS